MPLYRLVYRHNNRISVVIEPGASLVHARMRAALANLDQGEFTEGHGLSQEEAKRLLAKFETVIQRANGFALEERLKRMSWSFSAVVPQPNRGT